MKGKDTTLIMNGIDCVVIKTRKREWQKMVFLIANFISLGSLMPQLYANNLLALVVVAIVSFIIGDILLLEDVEFY